MKLNIGKAILQLETLDTDFDTPLYEIGVAIKVMKMWRFARASARNYEMGEATKLQVHRILEDIEGRFFPTKVKQTVTVAIERKSESLLEDTVDQIRLVPGVKEVKMNDKDS